MKKITTLVFCIYMLSGELAFSFWGPLVDEYGLDRKLQSYCYEDVSGNVKGAHTDLLVRPASVSKLYISHWIIDKLGKDFTFKTKIYYFNGNLHIEGSWDSFFSSENLFFLISELNKQGITKIKKLTFSDNFFLNWRKNPNVIIPQLDIYLNTELWPEIIEVEFEETVALSKKLNLDIEFVKKLELTVDKVEFAPGFNMTQLQASHFFFTSSPLLLHLKEMNIYSNNFMAQNYFDMLGGANAFSMYMKEIFGAGPDKIFFDNGAGFENNYTTCALTIRLLKSLKEISKSKGFNLKNLISIPAIDPGTLVSRHGPGSFAYMSLLAKTGTLRHTSTLGGFIYTKDGPRPFGIFNHTKQRKKSREFQDIAVDNILYLLGGPKPFRYKRKQYIPLVDSKFEIVLQN